MEGGPESLAEILSRLFVERGWGRRQQQMRLEEAWREVAGPQIAQATRMASFRRGVMEIEVVSPPLLHELAGFHKRRLLRDLQASLKGVTVKDLRFRLGAGPDGRPM